MLTLLVSKTDRTPIGTSSALHLHISISTIEKTRVRTEERREQKKRKKRGKGEKGLTTTQQTPKMPKLTKKQRPPLQIHKPSTPMHMQPKNRRQPKRKPRTKQRAQQPKQIAKHRDSASDDPSQNPTNRTQREPARVRAKAALLHDGWGAAEILPEKDIRVLAHDGAIDDASDDDSGHSDTPSDFRDDGGGGCEGWGGDGGADEAVDDGADGDVEGDCDGLEEDEGFGEILGISHFADELEEGDVAGVGDDDVAYAYGTLLEGGLGGGGYGVDFGVGWVGGADADHDD